MSYISSIDKFVIKGGTALLLCYNLNRFSEDIDLDSINSDIIPIVAEFCKNNNYTYRVAKDTTTVKRCFIHYGGSKPLKVEVSYRNKFINYNDDTVIINNIRVYNINTITTMKLSAYGNRDKIRDLYDITFLGLNYMGQLNQYVIKNMQYILSYKGIEQLDYLLMDQKDELIDNEMLAESFLTLWERLGML